MIVRSQRSYPIQLLGVLLTTSEKTNCAGRTMTSIDEKGASEGMVADWACSSGTSLPAATMALSK